MTTRPLAPGLPHGGDHRRGGPRAPLPALALLAALLAPGAALAGPPAKGPDPRNAARALAEQALAHYEAGRYAEAIRVFEEADRIFHAPTIVFNLARAYAGAGRLMEARALFVRLRDEKLPRGSPGAFLEAQKNAATEATALDRRIPTVQIALRGAAARPERVTLDDTELSDWAPERAYPRDPGEHRIAVVMLGGAAVTRTVTLTEGMRATLEIDLLASPPKPPPGAAPPDAPPGRRPWLGPAIGSLALGAVGLGVGIGTGFATLKQASTIDDRCAAFTAGYAGAQPGTTYCPNTAQNSADLAAARGMGIASTVAFALAGAGVVTGVVLLAVKPGGATTAVRVGPGSIGIAGAF